MTPLLLHAAAGIEGGPAGSPLYAVLPEHVPGLVAAALVPVGAWCIRRRAVGGGPWTTALVGGYRGLPAPHRFLLWLLVVTAAVHAGLVVGEAPPLAALFLADAVALLVVAGLLLLGKRWRWPARLVLTGSILAYVVAVVAGEPPDQVGLATKLVELAALSVALSPERNGRLRRLAASIVTVALVVVSGMAAWVGAFTAAEAGGGHHGRFAAPGTVIASAPDRPPTASEQAAADRLYGAVVDSLARYADPAVAAADGYQVEGLAGSSFHAPNAAYASDGRVLDPARPEQLVYAETGRGAVLLGAVFEMPAIGEHGPAIGGPLTVWHAHEDVCFSLVPPALSGLVSPFGGCPVGSIAVPISSEMIHVWVVPGAPTRFGDLDEEWLQAYLESRTT